MKAVLIFSTSKDYFSHNCSHLRGHKYDKFVHTLCVGFFQKLGFSGRSDSQDNVDINALQKLANHGNLDAQFKLGQLYGVGTLVPKNDKTAFNWMRRAAEGGHVQVRSTIGLMYSNGIGVAADAQRAFKWTESAAK